MAEPKNMDALVEVEYCLGRYLDANVAGIMDDVRRELTKKQGQERAEWNMSLGGILSSLADGGRCAPGIDTSSMILKATGEWNSKTTEDYIVMCKEAVVNARSFPTTLLTSQSSGAARWCIQSVGNDMTRHHSRSVVTLPPHILTTVCNRRWLTGSLTRKRPNRPPNT
ncbi:MAG TPA: hypothetical protein DD424_09010 [Porphyromonadaceae bacterium]|nr:hypothetical protein [Porphyromonadaceae bacterium]